MKKIFLIMLITVFTQSQIKAQDIVKDIINKYKGESNLYLKINSSLLNFMVSSKMSSSKSIDKKEMAIREVIKKLKKIEILSFEFDKIDINKFSNDLYNLKKKWL